MLDPLGKNADYFADTGRTVRLVAAVALTPFAAYFALAGLIVPIGALANAIGGDRQLAGLLLVIGVAHGLLGAGLCWLTLRLYRGKTAAGQVTVLPAWVVWGFLLVFLLPLSVGLAGVMLVEAYRAMAAGDFPTALFLGCGGSGFAAAAIRAVFTARRRLRTRREGGSPNASNVPPRIEG